MIYQGDCLDILPTLDAESVDSIVTDPPYGISFMGKKWDYDVPSVEIWRECLRVLKHGGHLLSFAGTRTQHRMAVNIEDAGFEIRDMIAWVYGSGFPKSLNIGKAVDKLQGNERATVREYETHDIRSAGLMDRKPSLTVVETKGTSEFEGWGTALKPALEPITVARKPLEKGLTVAENCLKWGVGGINIDGCRVGYVSEYDQKHQSDIARGQDNATCGKFFGGKGKSKASTHKPTGRFPANLIHDGSDEVVGLFPQTKSGSGIKKKATGTANGIFNINKIDGEYLNGDSGSAARFFYCAKASKSDRDEGLEGMPEHDAHATRINQTRPICNVCGCGTIIAGPGKQMACGHTDIRFEPSLKDKHGNEEGRRNHHPTVKPTALMRYLCRLVTPPGGVVLDPFMGSGSTGKAAALEGFRFIGIELEKEYTAIAEKRIMSAQPLFAGLEL